jgi:hypothetical protein
VDVLDHARGRCSSWPDAELRSIFEFVAGNQPLAMMYFWDSKSADSLMHVQKRQGQLFR